MRHELFCNNCGKYGHLFSQCKLPIISNGIIVYRKINNNYEILLIRRKNSISFIDFMRGKYSLDNIEYIINLFNNMNNNEAYSILNNNFETLWQMVWGGNFTNFYKNEEKNSKEKFTILKNGFYFKEQFISLDKIFEKSDKKFIETEWGFPKGRRNHSENDINCALREFEEETGYSKNDIIIINNLFPIEEIFTSYNCKSYKHKYFLAYMDSNIIPKNHFHLSEIDKIEWVNIENITSKFRYNNYEKIKIINILLNILNNYKIYI
tara:strand:- start:304 stop:1098 length:795 start_codon:yes stop_codon:yes gene_type:complete